MASVRLAKSAAVGLVISLGALVPCIPALADSKKLTEDQRIELLRGLSAEYAKIQVLLPISKRTLDFHLDGSWDQATWKAAEKQYGPAGSVGDLIQVTSIHIEK